MSRLRRFLGPIVGVAGMFGALPGSAQIAVLPPAISPGATRLPAPDTPSLEKEASGAGWRTFPIAYEIRLRPVGAVTVKAYDTGTDIFCPLSSLSALTGIVYDSTSRAHITINRQQLPDSASVLLDGMLYVSVRAFARAAHVQERINRHDAAITFTNAANLPASQRAARLAAREAWLQARETKNVEADGDVMPSSPQDWGGLSLDYAAHVHRNARTPISGYQLSAATAIAGGSLIGYLSTNGRRFDRDLRWRRVWGRDREITQLTIGETWSGGLGNMPVRGVMITNAPYQRPAELALLSLDGELPSDWSVEAHRHGEFLGFDSVGTDGRYTIPVPLHHGENPFVITAYGPNGEMRTFTRLVRTMPDMVPQGKLEYAWTMGSCTTSQCRFALNGDFRYGITPRVTVRGGASEYTWSDAVPTGMHLYIALSAVPVNQVGITVEHMAGGFRRVMMQVDPVRAVMMSGSYVRYAMSDAGARLGGVAGRQQGTFALRVAPWRSGVALDAQWFRAWDTLSSSGFTRIAATMTYAGVLARPYWRQTESRNARETFSGVETTVLPASWPGLSFLGPFWVRGAFERTWQGGWSLVQWRVVRNVARSLSLEAGTQWRRETRGTQAVLAATVNLDRMRMTTYAQSATPNSAGQVTQTLSGSLYWDASAGRMIPSANYQLGRSGMTGTVFLDRNGNGVLDADDVPLAGVQVSAGGAYVRTNENGHYSVWGLPAMEPLAVRVDTLSLGSPWLTPLRARIIARAAVDRATVVDIPVVTGGIAAGVIVCEAGPCAPANVVRLTHVATGRSQTTELFRDGTFYQMGLQAGAYTAVALEDARSARAAADPVVHFVVTPEETTDGIRVPVRRSVAE